MWDPYPGAWLFIATLALGYGLGLRRFRPTGTVRVRRARVASFALGTLLLWTVTDWPVGPLGAGHLASVNMARYLVFALMAPPLLLYGLPAWFLRRFLAPHWSLPAARVLSRPLAAFAVFNVTLLTTHLPQVVDVVGTSQLGSFAVDMLWLASGIVFWWPILGPLPELNPLPYPGRLLYLVFNVFIPTVPAAFLTFAEYPLYALYELAPPVGGLTAVQDQQVAGLTMKVAGGLILFGTASVLFFRWHQQEGGAEGMV